MLLAATNNNFLCQPYSSSQFLWLWSRPWQPWPNNQLITGHAIYPASLLLSLIINMIDDQLSSELTWLLTFVPWSLVLVDECWAEQHPDTESEASWDQTESSCSWLVGWNLYWNKNERHRREIFHQNLKHCIPLPNGSSSSGSELWIALLSYFVLLLWLYWPAMAPPSALITFKYPLKTINVNVPQYLCLKSWLNYLCLLLNKFCI